MLFQNQMTISLLINIKNKSRIHHHMRSIGFAINQLQDLNLDYLMKAYSIILGKFDDSDVNIWFEREYLKPQNPIFDTFNHKVELSWDQKFSEFNIQQQNKIALLKEELQNKQKSQGQLNHQRNKSQQVVPATHRVMSNLTNQLYGIQSPRIIETEISPNRQNLEYENTLSKSHHRNENQSQSYKNSTGKKNQGSTQAKKKKKKIDKSNGDIKQTNLTKILEMKENSMMLNDMNLLDQTFSGLLLNDSNIYDQNIKHIKINPLSPNSIINNKIPIINTETTGTKVSEDIQVSLQMLDKIETLEQQLKHREKINEDLIDKNKKLISKILEFKEQNQINVENAKEQILALQKQLKYSQEDQLMNLQEQEQIRQHMIYLEDENRVLNERLIEVEESQSQMKDLHQKLNEDIFEQGKLEVAVNMHEFNLKKIWFQTFKRSAFVHRRLRSYLTYKTLKRQNFMKLISYLYLRKNAAFQRHLGQIQIQKQINIKYAVLHSLYKNKKIMTGLHQFAYKKENKLMIHYFRSLYVYKQIQDQRRVQNFNALQVRTLFLKNRVMKSFKINKAEMQLPMNPNELQYYNKLIRNFRKQFYFGHLKFVCQKLIPWQNHRKMLAINKYNKTLVSQCYNNIFKKIMQRKKTFKPKIKQLRISHQKSLLVKAFSVLLFYKLEQQRKQPLRQDMLVFQQLRYLNLWRQRYQYRVNSNTKIKFFKLRWIVLRKKIALRSLQKACDKQHRLNKQQYLIQNFMRHKQARVIFRNWHDMYRERVLESRRIKFTCFREFKRNVILGRKINSKAEIIRQKFKLRLINSAIKVLQQFSQSRSAERKKIELFRQRHVDMVKRRFFNKFLTAGFTQVTQRYREDITVLQVILNLLLFTQDQLLPLQSTFDEKNTQAQFFLGKCCELENEVQTLQMEIQGQTLHQELHLREIDQLQQQIDSQVQNHKDLEKQNAQLEKQNHELQALHLKKLEEFKDKFVKSEQEIQILKAQVKHQDESKRTLEKENNIKLLHQLKKAHKTIEEMRKVMEEADKQITAAKIEVNQVNLEKDHERENLVNKHIGDIKEITFLVDKVKRENTDLKKEVLYLNEKLQILKLQQQQSQQQQQYQQLQLQQQLQMAGSKKTVRFEHEYDKFPSKHNNVGNISNISGSGSQTNNQKYDN
ncbi:UNKNOWN [Stylonychia lemnae]|uniref:Uncharacterized protein n=1 Tax=Stylonychia lemnae TaxID=5949 RepID=A0A078B208_STYLE|nr:UNKNOWN [Stylonychia lemnae]|eukprot:CDW88590.1 UNKNOWN [Stylonychia lemnae]